MEDTEDTRSAEATYFFQSGEGSQRERLIDLLEARLLEILCELYKNKVNAVRALDLVAQYGFKRSTLYNKLRELEKKRCVKRAYMAEGARYLYVLLDEEVCKCKERYGV